MIRGISHEETARETARYMGRYTMHDPEKILSYEEYRQLDLRVGGSAFVPCTRDADKLSSIAFPQGSL